MLVVQPVSSDIDDSCKWHLGLDVRRRNAGQPNTLSRGIFSRVEYLHPRNFLVVSEPEDEFIDDSVNTNGSAY
jgi:hypothetical protein